MDSTRTMQSVIGQQAAKTVLQRRSDVQRAEPVLAPDSEITPRAIGYGLPCAKCRTYYAADLKACPVCKSPQRVSPLGAPVATALRWAKKCRTESRWKKSGNVFCVN